MSALVISRLRNRHLVQPLRLMVVYLIKRPGGQAEIQAAEGVLDIAGAVEGEKAVAQHGVAPLRVHGQHQRGKAGNPAQPLDERFRPGDFFPVHRETHQNLPGHRAPADVNMPQKPLAGGLVVDADPVLVYIINYRILRGVDLLRENAAAGVFYHVVGARPVEPGVGASFFHRHRILRLVAVAVAVGGGENGDFRQIFAADAVQAVLHPLGFQPGLLGVVHVPEIAAAAELGDLALPVDPVGGLFQNLHNFPRRPRLLRLLHPDAHLFPGDGVGDEYGAALDMGDALSFGGVVRDLGLVNLVLD